MQPNRLKKFREASNLSRAGVADRLEVSERTVHRWERDGGVPDKKKEQLAELYGGVSIGYLMGWENEPLNERDRIAA